MTDKHVHCSTVSITQTSSAMVNYGKTDRAGDEAFKGEGKGGGCDIKATAVLSQ